MSFYKKIASLFTSTNETPAARGWVVADSGAKVWDDEPLPDEVVKWSGAMDDEGYATGIGVLQFIQKGKVGVTFEGQMLKGKFNGKGIYQWTGGDHYQGDFVDGKRTGKGIYKWADGDCYEGDFVNDVRTGKGIFIWADGDCYEGDFVNDESNGKGIFRWLNGDCYEGDFVNDLCSGKGIFRSADGYCYEGDYVNNARTGKGIYRWANGNCYEGDFVNEMFTGKGIFRWANGDYYEGDFINDVRTGKGMFRWADGDCYEGDFVNDVRTGKGIFRWADGNCYEGDFVNNKRNGKGIYRWADGDYYEGDFIKGERTGRGILRWLESGNYYEGDFIDGDRTGKGKFVFDDGESYEGEFLNDRHHGRGIYIWADGDVYEGQFVDNEPNGKGIFRYVNGDFYEGDVVDSNFHGRGVKRSHCCGTYYEGEFADDEYHGQGTLKFDDGSSYEGNFVEGEYNGRGIFRYADGSYYEGDLAEGEHNGRGIFHDADGSSYEGDFVGGEYSGKGIFRYADGFYYEGGFIDGEMHGYGTLYSKDGTILKQGQWKNGEFFYQAVGENIRDGSIFKTVQLKDAIRDYNLKKEFIYRIKDYEKSPNTMVRVYKGDAHIEGDMDLLSLFSDHGIAGVIVEGNLIISGSLVDSSSRSLASFLLVTADLHAENIIAGHAIISVHGKAVASNVIIGHSGTGSMDVKGNLQAKLLIAQDHLILVKGKIDAVTMTDSRSKQYIRQDYQNWQEILMPEAADELLNTQGTLKKSKEILRRILKSAPIFRTDLAAKLTSVAVGSDVEKGRFVSWPEMKKYLEELSDTLEEPLFSYRGDDGMKEEVLLFYEGDMVFDEMDLDAREFAVIIKGNLTVRGSITNENTDGASSLIVLGNLYAQNIAVGGQTFHVTGDLTAEGILCGSYNHGDMYVGGDVKAQLILADDYFFQFKGKVTGQQLDAWDEDDLAELMKVLDESVFDDEDDEPTFNFYSLQEALVAGRKILG